MLALLSLLVACGEPDEIDVREGEQETAFCDAGCTRELECGSGRLLDSCKADCLAFVSGLENVRPEAVEIVAECIRDLSCARFFDDQAFLPCWDRARRELEPSRSLRSFCRTWSTRWFECGAGYSIDECEADWVLGSSRYLRRILECAERPCDEIESCSLNAQSGGSG